MIWLRLLLAKYRVRQIRKSRKKLDKATKEFQKAEQDLKGFIKTEQEYLYGKKNKNDNGNPD